MDKKPCNSQDAEVRKGPWTMEEDLILINYIANHGEGVWNSLARSAGLKRTGKSCRLRWLNYLRPDVRRGNITPEEQLLIMELHAKWGNRWSKIAKHLPGRTDNEIKNYWRTRIQKHIKQADHQTFSSTGDSTGQIMSSHHDHDHMMMMNDGASTSLQVSTTVDHGTAVETYSPPSAFSAGNNINNMDMNFQPSPFPTTHHHESSSSNDQNLWTMEDFWSMQLLNAGD